MDLKNYNHPKADAPNFHANDYEEVDRETKDGWTIIFKKNSGGRIWINEIPPSNSNELINSYFPGGGCNFINGMLACSFSHINWQIPPQSGKQRDVIL